MWTARVSTKRRHREQGCRWRDAGGSRERLGLGPKLREIRTRRSLAAPKESAMVRLKSLRALCACSRARTPNQKSLLSSKYARGKEFVIHLFCGGSHISPSLQFSLSIPGHFPFFFLPCHNSRTLSLTHLVLSLLGSISVLVRLDTPQS